MTMTNAEWMLRNGYKFNDLNVLYTKDVGVYAISIKKNGAYTCLGTIKKICAIYAFMEWLDQEHKEPILDEVEKRYLSAVIRCKDCKYYRWESDMCDYPSAPAQNVVHEDDFCSMAERRTDE